LPNAQQFASVRAAKSNAIHFEIIVTFESEKNRDAVDEKHTLARRHRHVIAENCTNSGRT